MSRPFAHFASSLLSSLPSLPASSVAGPSSLPFRAFSTTSPTLVSKRKLLAKRRKAANLALQASRIVTPESVDPVLGRVHYRAPSSRATSSASSSAFASTAAAVPEATNPWQGSRLQKLLLSYDSIAYSSPPNYSNGERPLHLLPGISKFDQDILFGAVPHTSSALQYANNPDGGEVVAVEQSKQSEMLMRILDLRNASKESINVINRQKIIDEFGNGKDTGSSAVQAALFTAKIHNLLEHITSNPNDTSNKRSLRLLVQHRARHLKYWRRTRGEEAYEQLLTDLGLERGAVEGELQIPF